MNEVWMDITKHVGMIGANGRYCLYDSTTRGNGKVIGSVDQSGMILYMGYRVEWVMAGKYRIERREAED